MFHKSQINTWPKKTQVTNKIELVAQKPHVYFRIFIYTYNLFALILFNTTKDNKVPYCMILGEEKLRDKMNIKKKLNEELDYCY